MSLYFEGVVPNSFNVPSLIFQCVMVKVSWFALMPQKVRMSLIKIIFKNPLVVFHIES